MDGGRGKEEGKVRGMAMNSGGEVRDGGGRWRLEPVRKVSEVYSTSARIHYAISNLGLGMVHAASPQYRHFVEILHEADEKDSHVDSFADTDGAEVIKLESLEKLRIKNSNS